MAVRSSSRRKRQRAAARNAPPPSAPVTVRYVCPICRGPHARSNHQENRHAR